MIRTVFSGHGLRIWVHPDKESDKKVDQSARSFKKPITRKWTVNLIVKLTVFNLLQMAQTVFGGHELRIRVHPDEKLD